MLEFIKPILIAGFPLFLLSFGIIFWSIKSGIIGSDEFEGDFEYDFEDELKSFNKKYKQDKSAYKVNPVYAKWLFFGGGYYGLMALITYIHVEFVEIADFFKNYINFEAFIDQISMNAIIQLVVNSFLNIIPAFTWFLYWPDHIAMITPLYWLLASYFGYQLGSLAAKWYVKNKNN